MFIPPIECVDFILHSVNGILKKEFDCTLSDENIHILDPFTGTGTFITRLLQSGLIRPEDVKRKYRKEIHCNELVLLAYYVADVNIEAVFHDITERKEYLSYDNICLTDTFELAEKHENMLYEAFQDNSELIQNQRQLPSRVIVGNPPYSAGQGSANDNAQNLKYPTLDKRIEETYVAKSKATLRNSLYDSYIRAFRWASDRVHKNKNEGGVIGFVTNSKWLDSNVATGFRKCLEEEFSAIYILDLCGAIRGKSGEAARKEGQNIFDIMTGVCITILVHNPEHKGKANIYYHNIGDYLKREDKLKKVRIFPSILSQDIEWTQLFPNEHGDWLNHRSDLFGSFIALGDKKDKNNKSTFFEPFYSLGVSTNRNAWVYNFSKNALENQIKNTISFYNEQCEVIKNGGTIDYDSTKFSWSDNPKAGVHRNKKFLYENGTFVQGHYRPFTKQNLYFSRELNERVLLMPKLFPTASHTNIAISVNGTGSRKDFSCLITCNILDYDTLEKTQCFPLYYYEENKKNAQCSLLDTKTDAYTRHDGVTNWILKTVRGRFQNTRAITKEHIFYYVYGILHSKDYRNQFNADLKKSLPRIPIVDDIETFMDFYIKGKKLAELHLNYEDIPPCSQVTVIGTENNNFHVEKLRFPKKEEKGTIIYNSHIKIENIPLETYDYVVNGRSAIEWIMDRYQIKKDKDSGIINDPNHWATEHDKPRYILDLLLSVINVSMQTLEIVDSLPKMEFGEGMEKDDE